MKALFKRVPIFSVVALAALSCAMPASAQDDVQDYSNAEIIVTGSRIEQNDYNDRQPAVGLRRPADFIVHEVTIRGDSRDPKQRSQEIYAMLERAVSLADRHGVELAYGEFVITRVTKDNFRDIDLQSDSRPDSQRINLLVKARLAGVESASAAQRRIEAFVEAVPEVGRAQMDWDEDGTLSIVGPDQYRAQIADAIAADGKAMAAKLGPDYAVTIEGLNMPVQWARSGPAEVLLFIPYKLVIVPKP